MKLAIPALLLASTFSFTSCTTTNVDETVVVLETADGVAIVDTFQTSGTVTAIDGTKRKVSLTMAGGSKTTVKCGPDVVNFNQLQIGDRVNITVTEELAVFLGRGNPPSAAGVTAVALAPVGAKPGAMMADTVQITVQVTAVDMKKRNVTLKFPDGSSKVVKAGKQIDLATVKPDDNVTVQHTEALAITVEKP